MATIEDSEKRRADAIVEVTRQFEAPGAATTPGSPAAKAPWCSWNRV